VPHSLGCKGAGLDFRTELRCAATMGVGNLHFVSFSCCRGAAELCSVEYGGARARQERRPVSRRFQGGESDQKGTPRPTLA
jgi:hypothetical protein